MRIDVAFIQNFSVNMKSAVYDINRCKYDIYRYNFDIYHQYRLNIAIITTITNLCRIVYFTSSISGQKYAFLFLYFPFLRFCSFHNLQNRANKLINNFVVKIKLSIKSYRSRVSRVYFSELNSLKAH